MRIAICDDKKLFLDILSRIIKEELKSHNIKAEITTYLTGEAFLVHHKLEKYDVVFLDIVMPDINGFQIAKEIRDLSGDTYVIFVTTENNLVYDSFDYKPFNFIWKGSVENLHTRVSYIIDKLVKDIEYNLPVCFELPYGECKYIIPREIIYAKSKGNYVDFVLSNSEVITLRLKMDKTSEMLSSRLFIRIHNRTIVNMQHIARIDFPNSVVILNNQIQLEISRAYKNSLAEAYNYYMRELC